MSARSNLPENPAPPPLDNSEILAQLNRILESPPFRTSRRCSDLLRYVVQGACDGRKDLLKERTVGVAVFERDPSYDTNQDPVVRNTAGQVRKRLAQYYCEPGRDREIRIDLPPGAYVPEIHPPVTPPAPAALPVPPPLPARRRSAWAVAAAVAGLAVLGFILASSRQHTPTNLERFWGPVLRGPGAIVLCVGQGHTYKLKGDLDRRFEAEGENPGAASLPGSVPLSSVVPVWDRYVGINDAQATVRMAMLFAKSGKEVEVRGGRATALADLRGRPSVLVGAFNNSWTLSLTGELRFYFEEDPGPKVYVVRDRQHPASNAWRVRSDLPAAQLPEDYALVTRVFSPTTEQPIVVAAGITGPGTNAAGEFLTNPAYLDQALEHAPPGWDKKNVQFVLETRLFGGNAGPAKVVAAHYW